MARAYLGFRGGPALLVNQEQAVIKVRRGYRGIVDGPGYQDIVVYLDLRYGC